MNATVWENPALFALNATLAGVSTYRQSTVESVRLTVGRCAGEVVFLQQEVFAEGATTQEK